MLDLRDKARLLGITLSASLAVSVGTAFAITPDNLAKTIYGAKILAPGTQIKVSVKGEQAFISTFKNERANDKDTKIDALVIGKTVFDAEPAITNVTVYLYNNKAPSEYKAVSIRTSDVKAFEGGSVGQDALLSSIEIKSGKVQDTSMAIESRMMLAAAARRDVQIVTSGDDIEVSCKMPALSDEEYKFEAFKIAETALKYAGENSAAKRVRVTFFDPFDKGKYKQVVISLGNLSNIEKQVAAAFSSLQLTAGMAKVSASQIEPSDGPLMKERTTLLEKIQGLEEKGVGIAPFVTAYMAIDNKAAEGDTGTLAAEVKRLTDTIVEQEVRYADAKTHKPIKDGEGDGEKVTGNVGDVKKTSSKGKITRWALGYFPMPESNILKDPDGYLTECKQRFEAQARRKAEDDPRFPLALMWFSEVLKTNNRAGEASKFENQARSLSARMRPQ